MQKFRKFKERLYGIRIETAFREGVLSCVSDPRFGNREHIIIGLEGIPALPVKGPDLQDGKTLSEKGMVGMEDGCRSQIPAVTKCFLLLPCQQ